MVKVVVLYPCDPNGFVIGGVESFIKGVIEAAPADISYQVVGATTDTKARPVGEWTRCRHRGKTFDFYPLYAIKNPGVKPRIPATVRYELAALWRMPKIDADIIESHRIEHLLLHRFAKAYNLFIHQNMAILKSDASDIRWKFAPRLYAWLEKKVLHRLGNVFCVRNDAVRDYQRDYPDLKDKFHFQPTWMDAKKYRPITADLRNAHRRRLLSAFELDSAITTAVAVGRIDSQKDPMLMIEAVDSYIKKGHSLQLLWIGDGILRGKIESKVKSLELEDAVKFIGLRNADEIAGLLQIADFFLMSSAYEGMPIAVLEALACGCPVVSTAVGEVPRLVTSGVNGYLARSGDIAELCQAIENMTANLADLSGPPCVEVAQQYTCHKVLSRVYEGYAQLAAELKTAYGT